jgi:hypothetical protein
MGCGDQAEAEMMPTHDALPARRRRYARCSIADAVDVRLAFGCWNKSPLGERDRSTGVQRRHHHSH